jgi:hypothetical protein
MPMLLALSIGKAFSKPDFWSNDLALSPIIAVRPLTTNQMVKTRLQVAALSTLISWALVLAFLCLWLPLWANLDALSGVRIGFWMCYGHSVLPQYVIAALSLVLFSGLTWKFMVGGLWLGLSGNKKWFIRSMAIYLVVLVTGAIAMTILSNNSAVREWFRNDANRVLDFLEWIAAAAVIGKFSLAAYSWRGISTQSAWSYLLLWLGGTICFVTLPIVIQAGGAIVLMAMAVLGSAPMDTLRIKHLLLVCALLPIPVARLGLAARALAKNRHA